MAGQGGTHGFSKYSQRLVLPAMSVNRKVSVPSGNTGHDMYLVEDKIAQNSAKLAKIVSRASESAGADACRVS